MATTYLSLSEEQHRQLDAGLAALSKDQDLDKLMNLAVLNSSWQADDPAGLKLASNMPKEFYVQFRDIAEKCNQSGQWKSFRIAVHEYLHPPRSRVRTRLVLPPDFYRQDDEATQKSWEEPFIGDAANVLRETIINHTETLHLNLYSMSMSIIQSSGTGKSRLIDELAHTIPIVSLNTRPSNHSGFPAADEQVRDFLDITDDTSDAADKKYYCFLSALFAVLHRYFETTLNERVGIGGSNWSLSEKLRYLMTHEQTCSAQGPMRIEFYSEVLKQAKAYVGNLAPVDDNSLVNNAKALKKWLPDGTPLVLAIDEAHGLVQGVSQDDQGLVHLSRQLRKIVGERHIFTVLLSLAGKIQSYMTPAYMYPSSRRRAGRLCVLPPFTAVGFDQLAQEAVEENKLLLDRMISDEFMAMFGRPLFGSRYKHGSKEIKLGILDFASQKLRGGGSMPRSLSASATLACLATRLALQFKPTSLDEQLEQVEQHLRICLSMVKEDLETAITIAPSEPILAEASALITSLQPGGQTLPSLLRDTLLGTPGLSLGDRGELAGLLLLTMTRDTIVYPRHAAQSTTNRSIPLPLFFKTLLGIPNLDATLPVNVADGDEGAAFGEAFKDSRIHFNHFVKVTDSEVINRDFLWMIASRGAGILCADRQLGINAILVAVLDHKKPLGPDNIVIILLQMKNDKSYQLEFRGHLYSIMNPYLLRILEKSGPCNDIPFIRLVFALASSEAGAYRLTRPRTSPGARFKQDVTTSFTSYDFWCAGISKETFPVVGGEEHVYRDILNREVFGNNDYMALQHEPREAEVLKKSSNPATCKNEDHWRYIKKKAVEGKVAKVNVGTEVQVMAADDEDNQEGHANKRRKFC
ncbi:hypothetical protein H0H93_016449 [Arthromyces matolae]|nr:hypothetical protein H0H93_016449 [Arthromyces matolae]